MTEPGATRQVLSGLVFGESARWHDGQLWLCDWGSGEVLRLAAPGQPVTVLQVDSFPLSIDWLSDGRMLVVSGGDGHVLCREANGSQRAYAELPTAPGGRWNEIAVTADDIAFINGGAGVIVAVHPDGMVRQVADNLGFPNGMVVAGGGSTLVVAESHAYRLTAFEIEPGGGLANRRVWAELGDDNPDGICVDPGGGIWYADVPHKCCRLVHEGGRIAQTVEFDRGCFSCALSDTDPRELFVVATEWHGFDRMFSGPRTGIVTVVGLSPGPPSA